MYYVEGPFVLVKSVTLFGEKTIYTCSSNSEGLLEMGHPSMTRPELQRNFEALKRKLILIVLR